MEEEQQGEDTLRSERDIVYDRYTRHDGFRGWIQARSTAGLLYGDGAIELRRQALLVRGWHRGWNSTLGHLGVGRTEPHFVHCVVQ
jgi:hypothetical protein